MTITVGRKPLAGGPSSQEAQRLRHPRGATTTGLRPTLLWVHRWLGLTAGLLFTAVAFSGSLLLFQPQFFKWAHGEMIPDGLAQVPGSIDAWVKHARKVAPAGGEIVILWRPHVSHNVSDAGMAIFSGLEPGGLGNMGFAGVLIAPATGRVLGTFDVDRSPAYAPLFLHRDLWSGETGRAVSGIMAIASLFSLVMGVYLWWPQRSRVLRNYRRDLGERRCHMRCGCTSGRYLDRARAPGAGYERPVLGAADLGRAGAWDPAGRA